MLVMANQSADDRQIVHMRSDAHLIFTWSRARGHSAIIECVYCVGHAANQSADDRQIVHIRSDAHLIFTLRRARGNSTII